MLITLQTSALVDDQPVELPSLITLDDGTRVQLPVYFVQIGPKLAVTPLITADGADGLRIHFKRWIPTHLGPPPLHVPCGLDQSQAIDVAVSFDLDPTISWSDPHEAKLTWFTKWADERGLPIANRPEDVTNLPDRPKP